MKWSSNIFVVAALVSYSLTCAAQSRYNVTDLGTLGGNTYASAINSHGDVAGNSATATGNDHAFLWTASGGMQDLGTLGGLVSTATALNDSDEIIGTSTTIDNSPHNYFWFPSTGMMAFGKGQLTGVNSSGEVLGVGFGLASSIPQLYLDGDYGQDGLGTRQRTEVVLWDIH